MAIMAETQRVAEEGETRRIKEEISLKDQELR